MSHGVTYLDRNNNTSLFVESFYFDLKLRLHRTQGEGGRRLLEYDTVCHTKRTRSDTTLPIQKLSSKKVNKIS